eukprot:6969179-Pyramimonas_sp.AAC.1
MEVDLMEKRGLVPSLGFLRSTPRMCDLVATRARRGGVARGARKGSRASGGAAAWAEGGPAPERRRDGC